MKWMRFRVRTTSRAEDLLISAMQDIGLHGAQIEDHVPLTAAEKEQMFVDILPDAEPDDGSAVLSFFAEETERGTVVIDGEEMTGDAVARAMRSVIEEVRAAAAAASFSDSGDGEGPVDIGEGTITIEETRDVDWINNWKQYFHQFWIDDILVIPSWEEPAAEEREPLLTFHIDPGTAFGTGMHETTQLCIRQIRKHLAPGARLLDIGTGSGILSILALRLGAGTAVGTDLDPCTEPAVADNLAANGVDASRFTLYLGDLITDADLRAQVGEGCYDIAVANILADVLIPMAPAAYAALKPGGVFITSGIIEGREDDVAGAMRGAGFEVISVTAQGEWRCVVGRRKD